MPSEKLKEFLFKLKHTCGEGTERQAEKVTKVIEDLIRLKPGNKLDYMVLLHGNKFYNEDEFIIKFDLKAVSNNNNIITDLILIIHALEQI